MPVIYGSNVSDVTLSTACQMSTTTGGTETSNTTTIAATANPYAEIRSKGGASTAVASLPAPTGNGWIYYPGAGTFALGNWSAIHTHSAVSHGVNSVIRFYKYSAGVYTSIGSITGPTQTLTTKTSYTHAATSMASVTLASGDGIYVDLWWFDNNANAGSDNPTNFISNSGTAGVASDMQVTTSTFTPAATTFSRTVPATAALQSTLTRTITTTAALQSTNSRTVPTTAALSQSGIARTIPTTASIANTKSRTIPTTAALSQPVSRTIPTTAALTGTVSRTVPTTAALQSTGNPRTIPSSAALLSTKSRTVPTSAALTSTVSRTITTTAALIGTLSRTIPTSATLINTRTRTIPTIASLTQSAVFYASNVVQSIGGLTLSDQMSQVSGGTETSFTVTAPASGTNSYVELLAQGGSSSGTPVLPSPTGKGWSIPLQGNTILAGNWSSIFTLAKSGTTKTGASLIVRYYRRTMDGTTYLIGVSTLSAQSFSTTKTVYIAPSVLNSWPFQFIAGDTLYMDAFVWNGTTAWASDIFTVYVSNSATQGVYNDGIIIAPEMITTPAGLNCLISATNFQTGDALLVRDQSFTLADAIDQRSILTLVGEDEDGSLSYQRAMPVQLSDSGQGLLYTGAVNSDNVSKPAAGTSNVQLEHALTFMDNHYLVDKRANVTNYLNWSSGDMVCDFIQQTLSQEGVTGEFALESDYTPAAFGQGTLAGTVATTTTSPFVYAPNTATPPITSNTGDLELTRAGTQYTLMESVTTDFASGTLNNMVASNNQLAPSTQSAIKVTAQYSPVAGTNNIPATASGGTQTDEELIANLVRASIWTGSMIVGTNDTLNYDIWMSSTSPAFLMGIDIKFSDGSYLTDHYGTLDTTTDLGLFDSNGASVDLLQDLSTYAKDTWYTRTITLTGLNGKTINEIDVYLAGSNSGAYTFYVKNCYLGSHSGTPFFSTSATNIQDVSKINTLGAYLISTINRTLVTVYNPVTSYRISPSHSISGVGLVQNSSITWTASLPTSGIAPATYPPGTSAPSSSVNSSAMVMMVSYDGNTWLQCTNSQALPGLPPGANVSGLSLYLREQFQAGNDPTAIPALLEVQITINSAANQTVSDIVTAYGTSTQWNTGTQILTNPNGNGNLTLGGSANPMTQAWPSSAVLNQQTLLPGTFNSGTQSVSGGAFLLTTGANTGGSWCQSRFDWAGYFQDGTIEADVKVGSSSDYDECGIEYRQTGWGNANNNGAYYVYIGKGNGVSFGFGSNSNSNSAGSFTTVKLSSQTINAGTFYHLKVVVKGNRHTIYFNGGGSPIIDVIDNTYTQAGQVGFRAYINGNGSFTATIDNFSMVTTTAGTWTSPATSLTSIGTCGYNQVCWTDLDSRGQVEGTTTVLASTDNGSTWMQCTNGAEIPQLARGTSTSGMNLKFQMILYSSTPPISTPVIMGLYARICGNYGTVSGTRISPALSLSPVDYVDSSNVMWNANIPTSTSLTVQTTQDLSSFHTVGNNGAGEALTYWTNQPDATQDLFATNTSANYTSANKSGGSVASVTYTTTNSSLTLAGGSSALYLNNAISCADVDMLVDMDMSDAGGVVFRKVDASNFYEVGVYDASSSGGFTNQLRLYKVAGGTRTLLGSASSIVFTRGTFHRPRVTMQGGLINVYWDGQCVQSYLDTSPLGAGACGLRNDGGTSRYYQLWIQPLGTNLSGQVLYTKAILTTSDPAMMPQLFTLVACVRGPSIATGATISQLHSITKPFAAIYASEIDGLVQASGDFYWYVDKWRQLRFGARLARPGAFPVQSVEDSAGVYSGYLLYQPMVSVLSSADLFRSRQIVTNVSGLTTPPPEIKTADGSSTSWTMGYPLYSAPVILINGQGATVGLQGIDNNKQFYWQPNSPSISYDSSLPKLPAGTVLSFTYVGESPVNVVLNNTSSQTAQAALELNSGIVAEIQSALNSTASGMTTDQATTFGNGLLSRYGKNDTLQMIGTTRYLGLVPGTTISLFLDEIMSTWNAQLPIVKVTTTAYQGTSGIIYLHSVNATNGPSLSDWTRVFYSK